MFACESNDNPRVLAITITLIPTVIETFNLIANHVILCYQLLSHWERIAEDLLRRLILRAARWKMKLLTRRGF